MDPDDLSVLVRGLIFAGAFVSVAGPLFHYTFSPRFPPTRRRRIHDKRESKGYRKNLLLMLQELEEIEPGRRENEGRYREGLDLIRESIAKLERVEKSGRRLPENVFDRNVVRNTFYNAHRAYRELKRDVQ